MSKDYFRSGIGSTELGRAIISVEPPVICCDLLAKPVDPTSVMEMGKIFEDKIEQDYSGRPVFDDKYFNSNVSSWPSGVMEIIESDDVQAAIDAARNDPKHLTKSGALSKTYARKFQVLDQIAAHDYRRPIPVPMQEKLEIMTERFGNYPLRLRGYWATLEQWMREHVKTLFQVEHFRKHGDAECRTKFDMVWIMVYDGVSYALPFDLKVTGDEVRGQKSFKAFVNNWKRAYIWQSKHYLMGFFDWCEKNGYIPFADEGGHTPIYYVVQESETPQITHCWDLSAESLDYLTTAYNAAIPQIWEWMQGGRKIRGYMPQTTVDRWGRDVKRDL